MIGTRSIKKYSGEVPWKKEHFGKIYFFPLGRREKVGG